MKFKAGNLVRVKGITTSAARLHKNKVFKIKSLGCSKGTLLGKKDYAILDCSCPGGGESCGGIWFYDLELCTKSTDEISFLDSLKDNEVYYYE